MPFPMLTIILAILITASLGMVRRTLPDSESTTDTTI